MNANLQGLCTRKHKTEHGSARCPPSTRCLDVSVASMNMRGVHVRPGSKRATSPNGPPLSCCSRSLPEAVCLQGFGQTLPVLLASPLKGRNSGDPAGSTRLPSFWSLWCPSVLLDPGSTASGLPQEITGGVPLCFRRAVAVLSPMSLDPVSSAGGAYAPPAKKTLFSRF
ncbi:hypothetical protein P4O66_008018 [Electrophorus voltai]|uniref:Uncharacterized protein n=1 Tax=Electrophorus voltai TaxID=2609070 RepID=A0AAD9DYH4_9TELE|nr:hypothetical protein P4O66_008018 [Electrophorus voltai]